MSNDRTLSSEECCDRPRVVTMDYDMEIASKNGSFVSARRLNRVCTRCWVHWFGVPGKVKRYTKAEWDKWMNSV
jgi:hypothetical protein